MKRFGSRRRLPMTPTGQPAPETAGWEHPTRLFRLTVVSGPDPWTIRYGCPVLTGAVRRGDGEYP